MELIKLIGSIILTSITIINITSFNFKLRECIFMIGLVFSSTFLLMDLTKAGSIIPVIVIPILFLYRKSKNIVYSVSIPIISIIIDLVIDTLWANICIFLFNIDVAVARNLLEMYFPIFVGEFILVFIVSKVLGKIIDKRLKIINLKIYGKSAFLLILSTLLTFIIIYFNIFMNPNSNTNKKIIESNSILFLAYFILLTIIVSILIKGITKDLEYKNKQVQLENLHEYTNKLEQLNTEMRAFRHDYINVLSSLIGYIENKDMDGLEKHFNDKIVPFSNKIQDKDFKINLLKNIKIPELKGIISSKLIRAQELKIDVGIEITEPIEKINMDIIELSRCIGILLDNAIEAAEKTDNPVVKVSMIKDKKSTLIIIINSYPEDTPPIYKILQTGISTKGNGRGIGLKNFKDIVDKYKKKVYTEVIIENNEFKQFFEIME
ncbi:MAG: sensor histidine kinase [Clostridiaceae bacterium]